MALVVRPVVRPTAYSPVHEFAVTLWAMSAVGQAVRVRRAGDRPDADLVLAVAGGDARAFEALVLRHQRVVFSVARTAGLDRDDAADVTQMAFSALATSAASITQPEHVRAWLCTIARRQSWRIVERRRRERPGDVPDDAVDADTVARTEAVVDLVAALDQLRPRCRDLIVALYLADPPLDYESVAAHLGMPIGSIGPTRARCLAQLRAAIAGVP